LTKLLKRLFNFKIDKKLLIIIGFLLFTQLNAADVNATLVKADGTVYTKLLHTLRHYGKQNEQFLLQEALLEKLLTVATKETFKQQVFTTPNNQTQAKYLFVAWLENIFKKSTMQQQQNMLHEKMTTLQNQLQNLSTNDSALLSYQLQYALYAKQNRQIAGKIKEIQTNVEHIKAILFNTPKTLLLQKESLTREYQILSSNLVQEEKKLKMLQLKKERLVILGNKRGIASSLLHLTKLKSDYKKISYSLTATNFLLFCNALTEKNHTAFKIGHQILQHPLNKEQRDALQSMLTKMEKEYLGIISTFGGTTIQQMENTSHSLWSLLSTPLFEINKTSVNVLKILSVIFIFIFGFFAGSIFKKSILKPKVNDNNCDTDTNTSSRIILSNIGYYVILTIAFFSALNVLGLNLSSFAVVAGALSVGIGFGLQNIVSNFVSGIILMFERSIKIGDYIQLSDDLRGRVTDIRMRSTTIKTNANIDVIIPNQNFIQNNVINWTMEDSIKRFKIPFDVKYGTVAQDVINIVLKAVNERNFSDMYVSRTRYARVLMTGMGDSSVNFELLVWVKGKAVIHPRRTTSRFLILIYTTLNDNNIEIPFPQRDLHIRTIETTLPIVNEGKS